MRSHSHRVSGLQDMSSLSPMRSGRKSSKGSVSLGLPRTSCAELDKRAGMSVIGEISARLLQYIQLDPLKLLYDVVASRRDGSSRRLESRHVAVFMMQCCHIEQPQDIATLRSSTHRADLAPRNQTPRGCVWNRTPRGI